MFVTKYYVRHTKIMFLGAMSPNKPLGTDSVKK